MIDYSSQEPHEKRGKHVQTIDLDHFRTLLNKLIEYDFDIMLEIKDKEKSAIEALKIAAHDPRLRKRNVGYE